MCDRQHGNAFRSQDDEPIDVAHLARQSMGDRALQREVVALFIRHARSIRDSLRTADEKTSQELAHSLKGAARAVGAFALADFAAEIEDLQQHPVDLERLSTLIAKIESFANQRF